MSRKERQAGTYIDVHRFEQLVMVHLHAAHNLARWLTRNERDAEDLAQEACLRALKFIDTFHGGNSRAWLLAIVRNTHYSTLRKNRAQALEVPLDGTDFDEPGMPDSLAHVDDAATGVEREESRRRVQALLEELPTEFREVIVLRELEDLSYQEIAAIVQIPVGTVMSRLSRARKLLYRRLRQPGEVC